ncbi:MAG: alpha/beta-type small acid-soluble spore protein [Ruminococcus sp.]|nr:alpha/beta-type small acid-soluble spore protein [Ruminococcus sp.]
MSNSNNSGGSNKGVMTQKGREALERFKMESANELGIDLKDGYNGDLTSREAGSIGGSMVKKMIDSYKMQ